MNRLGIVLISGVFAAVSLRAAAESTCTQAAVQASVEAEREDLTLADLLARDSCPQLREAAARVSLGANTPLISTMPSRFMEPAPRYR